MRSAVKTSALLVALLATNAYADESANAADDFNEVSRQFASTCLEKVFSKVDLASRLNNDKNYLAFTDEQAHQFLRGRSGKAWGVQGRQSPYVVALWDNGFCSVYAARADQEDAMAGLPNLLHVLFPGVNWSHITDSRAGPNTDLVKSEGWYFDVRERNQTPLFFVTTSRDPNVNFEALYTVSIGNPDAR